MPACEEGLLSRAVYDYYLLHNVYHNVVYPEILWGLSGVNCSMGGRTQEGTAGGHHDALYLYQPEKHRKSLQKDTQGPQPPGRKAKKSPRNSQGGGVKPPQVVGRRTNFKKDYQREPTLLLG